VSSVYAFANGFGNSPYAVAKPGVEALGRGLRVELAPHGASATVAYFGWVDTPMVHDALSQPDAQKLNEGVPAFLLKRIKPDEAAAAFVRGIEERAPRVFAPKWWRYISAFRGLINPLLDKRMERDANAQALLRDIDARATGKSG
jgi:NAD(P)-dependent dehydrogenase (short-subunit alcohol dehydrogenase family)